jgi:hypothetical protein
MIGRFALLACAAALCVCASFACSGGSDTPRATSSASSQQATAGATASPDAAEPIAAFRSLLDAINRRDAAAVYEGLSTEARASLSSDDVRALVDRVGGEDAAFSVELQKVGDTAVNGDQAQIGMTLVVHFQGRAYPLTEVAFLAREGGRWKLSDHFLQTALAAAGRGAPAAQPRVIGADGCAQGDVLDGVYLPSRLKVLEPCVTIEAVVRDMQGADGDGEGDGDLSFDVEVSGDDRRLLNDGNVRNMHGWLHLEIVPLDQPRLPKPKTGDRIRATGPWVLDSVHGHNEIHPVWSLEILAP